MATIVWLIEHGFQLNNREWASLIWLGILALWSLPQAQLRQSLGTLIRLAMSPKLLIVLGSLLLWVVLMVIVAQWQSLWDPRLTKDTLVWAVTAGMVSLGGIASAHEEGFFRRAVWKVAGVSAFVEYLVSLSAFPLFIEIMSPPLILVFVIAPRLGNAPEIKHKWQAWGNRFFLILGLALLGNTALSILSEWNLIDWRLLVLRAAWPVSLGLWILLLVFAWSLVSSYELAFLRLKWARADPHGRWKAKAGLILGLGTNLEWIHHAAKGGTFDIARAQSVRSAWKASIAFKQRLMDEKKAEQTYQENLIRFANNSSLDEHSRPIDKREFRETRKALDWLSTCQMGWFHHDPIGYKHDLLDRFGDDFTSHGLPTPSGIVMKVTDDGTKWYAWRCTVGGHHFAIGANGEPSGVWRYDGHSPPTGFPGDTPEWGQSQFDVDVSPNWSS